MSIKEDIKEDIEKVQKKVDVVEEKSFAMEVLQYSKQQQLQMMARQ